MSEQHPSDPDPRSDEQTTESRKTRSVKILVLALLVLGGVFAYHSSYYTDLVLVAISPPPASSGDPRHIHPHPSFDLESCTVPTDTLLSGGPGIDGIPSLSGPTRVAAAKAEFMRPEDKVIGVRIGEKAVAYPIRVLIWHECVNDTVGEDSIAVTYCPLCDSAFVFDRRVGDETLEFGISGLLLNSNVLLFDRREKLEDSSLWSQVAMRAVCGPAAASTTTLKLLPGEYVTWERWVERHPDSEVLTLATGHRRDYDALPYGSYFTNDRLMFPIQNICGKEAAGSSSAVDGPIPDKTLSLVVTSGEIRRVYPYAELEKALGESGRLTDRIGEKEIAILYDRERKTARVDASEEEEDEPATAYTYWFAWESLQDEYEVFMAKAD